jgi:hypothetical protein
MMKVQRRNFRVQTLILNLVALVMMMTAAATHAQRLPGTENGHFVVIGHVVGIYIDDQFIDDGMVNTGAMQPIARMGYMEYSVVRPETVFAINRPAVNPDGTLADVDPGEWDGVYR